MSQIRIVAAKGLSFLLLGILVAHFVLPYTEKAPEPLTLWPDQGSETYTQDGHFAFQMTFPPSAYKLLVDLEHPDAAGIRRGDYAGALQRLETFSDTLPNFRFTPSAFGGEYATSQISSIPEDASDAKDKASTKGWLSSFKQKTVRFTLDAKSSLNAKVVVTAVDAQGDVVQQKMVLVELTPSGRVLPSALPSLLLNFALALSILILALYASALLVRPEEAFLRRGSLFRTASSKRRANRSSGKDASKSGSKRNTRRGDRRKR